MKLVKEDRTTVEVLPRLCWNDTTVDLGFVVGGSEDDDEVLWVSMTPAEAVKIANQMIAVATDVDE